MAVRPLAGATPAKVVCDAWKELYKSLEKTAKDKHLMQLIHSLYFIAATRNYTVLVSHIDGMNNTLADALSRGQVEKFKTLAPLADLKPTPLPTNWESLRTTTFGSFNGTAVARQCRRPTLPV